MKHRGFQVVRQRASARARWPVALVAIALLAALLPTVASAHPLGNFTVNHYASIDAEADALRIQYVLDEAEIPTFQDKPAYSADAESFADARAAAIGSNLHVTLGGQPLPLQVDSRSLTFADGAGGLQTLRLEISFSATYARAWQPAQLEVHDDNDPTRIGWREIVASGPAIERSSVPSSDVTSALRSYPEDLLNSPLDVRNATLALAPVPATAAAPGDPVSAPATGAIDSPRALAAPAASGLASALAVSAPGANPVLERARTAFADLANADELTPAFIIFAVGVALVLGAAHALQPGHGKTVVAAYLVGSRGTARHAAFLGATVTATHTAGVYALGLVTLLLSQYIVPERLYPVLEVGSGLLVLVIGVWLLGQRLQTALGLRRAQHHHHHGHEHHHGHDHEVDHSLEDHSEGHHSWGSTPVGLQPVRHDSMGRHTVRPDSGGNDSGGHHSSGSTPVGLQLVAHDSEGHHSVGQQSVAEQSVGHDSVGQQSGEPCHHGHSHEPAVGWRSLLALGVSGGLLPCPEALMVLLITIAAHRVLFGLLLIVSFSTGLAAVLVGFGLLLVYARSQFQRLNFSSTGLVPRVLPVASAFVIVVAGSLITLQALPQVL